MSLDKSKKYWFVGASFGGVSDESERFINDGIWESSSVQDIVNTIDVGDYIAIKSTFTRKNNLPFVSNNKTVSVMRIKAIGRILQNFEDSKKVKVDWDDDFLPKDWFFYTHRGLIWKPESHEKLTEKLISFTFDDVPQDYDYFISLPYWKKQYFDTETEMNIKPTKLFKSALEYKFNDLLADESEKLRLIFIKKFPLDQLNKLDHISFAGGKENNSFCYWLEFKNILFGIGGGSAQKFGLYKSKSGVYKTGKGASAKIVADEKLVEVFNIVKNAMLLALKLVKEDNIPDVLKIQTPMTNMVLLKILSIYYPEKFLTIGKPEILIKLADEIGVNDCKLQNSNLILINYLCRKKLNQFKEFESWHYEKLGSFIWNYYKLLAIEPDIEPSDLQANGTNTILYGPPGTGKTFHTVTHAVKAAEPDFFNNLNVPTFDDITNEQREQIKDKYDELVDLKRIRFVTFHQSYGYEEFVEGLRAKTDNENQISYSVEPGVFREICEDASKTDHFNELPFNLNGKVWKLSIEGTGNVSNVRKECFNSGLAAIGWGDTGNLSNEPLDANQKEYRDKLGSQDRHTLEEFSHKSKVGDLILCINSQTHVQAIGVVKGNYNYKGNGVANREDYRHVLPVDWIVKGINLSFYELNKKVNFTQKTFYVLDRMSVVDVVNYLKENQVITQSITSNKPLDNYVLIIDEINRGNISKIFGELITLIEESKRENQPETLSAILPYSNKNFTVPNNLHLIGTMNTADRSLAILDTALRRRFDFIEMMPNPAIFNNTVVNGISIESLLTTLNQRIEYLYDREHTLGHAFFIKIKDLVEQNQQEYAFVELQSVFKNKIIPLLEEYFFEDWEKIRLVLGDNQKTTPEHIFISKTEIGNSEVANLFGSSVDNDFYEQTTYSYKINTDAFSNVESYQSMINNKA